MDKTEEQIIEDQQEFIQWLEDNKMYNQWIPITTMQAMHDVYFKCKETMIEDEWIDFNKEQPEDGEIVDIWGKRHGEYERHTNMTYESGNEDYRSSFTSLRKAYMIVDIESRIKYWRRIPKKPEVK